MLLGVLKRKPSVLKVCPQRKLGVLKRCKLNCALLYISCIVSKLWHIRYHKIGNYVNTSVPKSVSKFDYQHASGCVRSRSALSFLEALGEFPYFCLLASCFTIPASFPLWWGESQ